MPTGKPLQRIEIDLDPGRRAWRHLWALPEFIRWLDEVLPGLECEWTNSDPQEQLDSRFSQFVHGDALIYESEFREIEPSKHGVWELKTPLLRVFGWFIKQNNFVCAYGELADKVKDHGLYNGFRNETIRCREALPASLRVFVSGVEYDDILSDAPDR